MRLNFGGRAVGHDEEICEVLISPPSNSFSNIGHYRHGSLAKLITQPKILCNIPGVLYLIKFPGSFPRLLPSPDLLNPIKLRHNHASRKENPQNAPNSRNSPKLNLILTFFVTRTLPETGKSCYQNLTKGQIECTAHELEHPLNLLFPTLKLSKLP
jgi:hypothetical protein